MAALYIMVQYIEQDQLNDHQMIITLDTSKMAVTKMGNFCCLASKQHFVPIEIILNLPPGSQFESIVLVIGGFQVFHEFATKRLVHQWMAHN